MAACAAACWTVDAAEESFEELPAGPLAAADAVIGTWEAEPGHAEVHDGHAHGGRHSLRLLGGASRSVDLRLRTPLAKPAVLACQAERWTSAAPFAFVIEAAPPSGAYREIHDAGDVTVGGFLTRLDVVVPAGTSRIRFRATSPDGKGVMIDDVSLQEQGPMTVADVTANDPVVPVLVRRPANPVVGIAIRTTGTERPLIVEEVSISLAGTTHPTDVESVEVHAGGASASDPLRERIGFGKPAGEATTVRGRLALVGGDNRLWVTVRLRDGADLDGRVAMRVTGLRLSGSAVAVPVPPTPQSHRVGVAVRLRGDDGSDTYRIPGLVRTAAGSLLAVYDVRYRGSGDLPGDIDVGCSRSTDGGRSWEPMRIAIDMGRDPGHAFDGVGDPCVFVDRETGRIFVAALWSHGKRAWNGSEPGLTPDETGQMVIATSDDDGRTWSKPRNLTGDLKDPAWRLLLAGPGTGITLRNGTLVFPAQFRDAAGVPHSTMAWSQDHGESWHIGTGVKPKTTESQLVELANGAIMINCRDDRGGSRTVAVTRDLGGTWQPHATDRTALPESVCMASLLRLDVPGVGPRLFFSNPATTAGRHTMTLKVSDDEGLTWPASRHLLYDVRDCYGYSCLAPVDDRHLGVLYEGAGELFFLRIPVADLLGAPGSP